MYMCENCDFNLFACKVTVVNVILSNNNDTDNHSTCRIRIVDQCSLSHLYRSIIPLDSMPKIISPLFKVKVMWIL